MKKVRVARPIIAPHSASTAAPSRQLIGRVTGVVGLIALIGAIGIISTRPAKSVTAAPVPVTVSGTASVASVDGPARQPFGRRFFPSAATPATFVVPAGKRLVITDVAAFSFGSTTVEDVALFTTVAGTGTGRTIPFTVNNHGLVYADATFTDTADPGSTITIAIDDTNFNDSAGMNVDIHGYYVDVP